MTDIAKPAFRAVTIAVAMAAIPVSAKTPPLAGLTLQAFQQRQTRQILAADEDGDGRVSLAEFLASAKGTPTAARFARLDRNGDGFLTQEENAAGAAKRFARRDRNGDGIRTPQERHPARAAGTAAAAPGTTGA